MCWAPSSPSASPPSFKVHDICTPVLRRNIFHPAVLAAHLLQGVLSTFQGSPLPKQPGRRWTPLACVLPIKQQDWIESWICQWPTCLFLQGWVYNVVPWLSAIPLAVGGGYVSDFLVNKGTEQQFAFGLGVNTSGSTRQTEKLTSLPPCVQVTMCRWWGSSCRYVLRRQVNGWFWLFQHATTSLGKNSPQAKSSGDASHAYVTCALFSF